MRSDEMQDVARFFARALISNEDPSAIGRDVAEFKSEFQTVHYCFEPGPAYPGLA
jgi:glycine/serine hydroxymethyltransferase